MSTIWLWVIAPPFAPQPTAIALGHILFKRVAAHGAIHGVDACAHIGLVALGGIARESGLGAINCAGPAKAWFARSVFNVAVPWSIYSVPLSVAVLVKIVLLLIIPL